MSYPWTTPAPAPNHGPRQTIQLYKSVPSGNPEDPDAGYGFTAVQGEWSGPFPQELIEVLYAADWRVTITEEQVYAKTLDTGDPSPVVVP